MENKKAQVWYADYIIGVLIFVLAVMIFYAFSNNYVSADSVTLDDLSVDSKYIASALLHSGYPDDWDSVNVTRIGLTNNNNRLDERKVTSLKQIEYGVTKILLGTMFDYTIIFKNRFGKVIPINGSCSLGNDGVLNLSIGSPMRIAYVSSGIKDFGVLDTLSADYIVDLYMNTSAAQITDPLTGDIYTISGDIDEFVDNISTYSVVLLDDARFDIINKEYKPSMTHTKMEIATAVEEWVASGNWLWISGAINLGKFLDVDFGGTCYNNTKYFCTNVTYNGTNPAIVTTHDSFIDINSGESLYYAPSTSFYPLSPQSYVAIASYNNSLPAIARWSLNAGTVYYISATSMTGSNGTRISYPNNLKGAAALMNVSMCSPPTLNGEAYDYLVPVTRFLIYRSELVSMNLYLWR